MDSHWLTKLENALAAGHPLRFEPCSSYGLSLPIDMSEPRDTESDGLPQRRLKPFVDASLPADAEVACALFAFFKGLATDYRSAFSQSGKMGQRQLTKEESRNTRHPSIQRLVHKHLDAAVAKFFAGHFVSPRPGGLSVKLSDHATGESPSVPAARVANAVWKEWTWSYPLAADKSSAEATINLLRCAFEFVAAIPVKSRRISSEGNQSSGNKKRKTNLPRTEKRDINEYELCERCEAPTERYEKSIIAPHSWGDGKSTIHVHYPLPRKVVCKLANGKRVSDRFCANCKTHGPRHSAGDESKEIFDALVNGCDLTELLRTEGIPANSITRRRIARLLAWPDRYLKEEVDRITRRLKQNATCAEEAVRRFFGVPLPENLSIARGQISGISAHAGIGGLIWDARGEQHQVSLAIDSLHVQHAINLAIDDWSGLPLAKRGLRSVELDMPELGLVLTADVRDRWSISAYIDRAQNYEWILPYLRKANSDRQRLRKRARKNQASRVS